MERHKYPRTPHLAWSANRSDDDIGISADAELLTCGDVVATLKLDGECTTIYPDGHSHARSIDSRAHPSRTSVRAIAARIGHLLPDGWRVCGENMQAQHSIRYEQLADWLYCFAIFDHTNTMLAWDDTVEWCALLDIPTVPTIWRGPFDRTKIEQAFAPYAGTHEGYVVRDAGPVPYLEFARRAGKWVRRNHVRTSRHWMSGPMILNGLTPGADGIPDANPNP